MKDCPSGQLNQEVSFKHLFIWQLLVLQDIYGWCYSVYVLITWTISKRYVLGYCSPEDI